MVRRVRQQGPELLGVFGTAIVVDPVAAGCEFVKPQHVHHPNGRQTGSEQLGPLSHYGSNQQAAVAATHHGELVAGGVVFGDQVLSRRNEVVENVLLVELCASPVPGLSVLSSAAEVRHRKHASHFHPLQATDGKSGGQRNVETAVAIEQRGAFSVELCVFVMCDKHRHPCSVLALVKDLLDDEVVGCDLHLCLFPESALACDHVVTVDAWRGCETGK